MQNYDQFWFENNKKSEQKKVVVKIKRPPTEVKTTKTKFVVKKKLGPIARGPASTPVRKEDLFDFEVKFDPVITASAKWRSQFHYPDENSEYMVKDGDYKSTIDL